MMKVEKIIMSDRAKPWWGIRQADGQFFKENPESKGFTAWSTKRSALEYLNTVILEKPTTNYRVMVQVEGGHELKVYAHAITVNFWEYYITSPLIEGQDIVWALVIGDEQEMGDVSLSEIKPYLRCFTRNLKDIMPAAGYRWRT